MPILWDNGPCNLCSLDSCVTKSGKVSNVQIDLTGIELNSYVYIYKTRFTCRYKSNCDDMICRSVRVCTVGVDL